MNTEINKISNQLRMFILDVLRHDVIEQVPSIIKMLNDDGGIGWRDCWPHDFSEREVLPELELLVRSGHVQVLLEQESGNEVVPIPISEADVGHNWSCLWFGLTPSGRDLWNNWVPPKSDGV